MPGAGLARFDAHGRLVWANPAFADSVGGLALDAGGATLAALLAAQILGGALADPDGRTADELASRLTAGEMTVLRRRGGVWVALALAEDGTGGRLLSVTRTEAPAPGDRIAERTRELRENQVLLETTFDAMVDAVAGFDADLRLVLWNRNYVNLFRLPPELARVGTRFEDIVQTMAIRGDCGDVDIETYTAERTEIARRTDTFRFQFMLFDSIVFDAQHCPLPGGGFLRRYTDITDRARMEETQRTLLEAIPMPLVVTRVGDGLVLLANQPALDFFGRGRDEVQGRLLAEEVYVVPGDRHRMLDALRQGGGVLRPFETRMRSSGGHEVWVLVSMRAFRFDGHDAVLSCISDISVLKQAQAHLIQSEKMAALGSMVAGVAHEINTPVGIALTGASLLAERTETIRAALDAGRLRKSELADFLETAAEASQLMMLNVDRAAQLIQSFKQMAVDQASEERRAFGLRDYINEVLRSLGVRLRRAAHTVEVDCPADLVLDSYPGALSQLLTNFIMNSLAHAYGPDERGHLRISVRCPTEDDVELVYADDGRGIPPELHTRVFDPFFTTSRGSGGSGLGLNIVYIIVTRTLKGRIDLTSAPGQGATFTLRFPRVAGA